MHLMMLDVITIYRIIYTNSIAAMHFSHIKSTGTDFHCWFLVPVLLPRTGATENRPITILHVLTLSVYAVVCCNKPQFLYQEMVNIKNENFKSADMSKKEWRSNLNHVNILKLLWEASVFA